MENDAGKNTGWWTALDEPTWEEYMLKSNHSFHIDDEFAMSQGIADSKAAALRSMAAGPSGSSSSATDPTGPRRALISIINNGEAFVWSADDVAFLRRNHGIVGLLTGSLPLIPQQNAFLGVPLQLFDEEVVYLLRQGAAIVVDDADAHAASGHLDDAARQTWHTARRAKIDADKREAAAAAEENRRKWMAKVAANPKAEARRKAREEQRSNAHEKEDEASSIFAPDKEDGYGAHDAHRGKSHKASKDKAHIHTPQEEDTNEILDIAHPVLIPAASAHLPWHNVRIGENAYESLSTAKKAGLWSYPSNAKERAHCAAFEALRAKAYFLGKGLRFGGDFVVYPGDPLRYHSHFTATVQTTPHTSVSAQELVAAGRLGTAVKKAHLLCAVEAHDKDTASEVQSDISSGHFDHATTSSWGQVDFYSLTWAGFGT